MKYIILSINNDRARHKASIRRILGPENEIVIDSVDGRDLQARAAGIAEFPDIFSGSKRLFYDWSYAPNAGEIGVWLSNLRAYRMIASMDEPVVVFEDDSILSDDFHDKMDDINSVLPEDFDLMMLFTPHDCIPQLSPYSFIGVGENDVLTRTYQNYSFVSVMYSPRGARRVLAYCTQFGVPAPIDIFVMQLSNSMGLNGYSTSDPAYAPVDHDWLVPTTIHIDEESNVIH